MKCLPVPLYSFSGSEQADFESDYHLDYQALCFSGIDYQHSVSSSMTTPSMCGLEDTLQYVIDNDDLR